MVTGYTMKRRLVRVVAHVLDMIRIRSANPDFDPMLHYRITPDYSARKSTVYENWGESHFSHVTAEENFFVQLTSPQIFKTLTNSGLISFSEGVPNVEFGLIPNKLSEGDEKDLKLVGFVVHVDKRRNLVCLDSYHFYQTCAKVVPWLNLNESFFESIFKGSAANKEIIETLRIFVAASALTVLRGKWHDLPDRGSLNSMLIQHIETGHLDLINRPDVTRYLSQPTRSARKVQIMISLIQNGLVDFAHNKGVGQQNYGPISDWVIVSSRELSGQNDRNNISIAEGLPLDLPNMEYLKNKETGEMLVLVKLNASLRKLAAQMPAQADVLLNYAAL